MTRVRRTQAERSASTKAALTEAAIRALYEHGYAATTTMLVAEEAGVSRGAMLHQFGTKHDLMTHVVETVYEEELRQYAELLTGLTEPAERLLAMCDAVWTVLSRPSGVAVLEIMQGSRSDPVLAERLAPVQARIEEDALASVSRSTGLDRATALSLMRLMVWSARGLSIAKVLAPDQDHVADAMGLLRRLIENAVATRTLALRKRGERTAASATE
ncbi:MAG TPA: TetR/AcrR family transcriptional regulator [Sphingomonas sp.]|nr:TetR/AcrR family transcriptional regulator [Sphingomonas sp.]